MFFFTPNLGEMIQFDHFFSNGCFNHQLVKLVFVLASWFGTDLFDKMFAT